MEIKIAGRHTTLLGKRRSSAGPKGEAICIVAILRTSQEVNGAHRASQTKPSLGQKCPRESVEIVQIVQTQRAKTKSNIHTKKVLH